MKDFVKRMITERDELKERIDKLEKFINQVDNGNAKVLDYEFDAMRGQLDYMEKYYVILNTRIGFHTLITISNEKETENESI